MSVKLFLPALVLLLFFTQATFGSETLPSGQYANKHFRYFIDDQNLNQYDVIKNRDSLFPQIPGTPHSLPMTRHPVWLLLEADISSYPSTIVFTFSSPGIDKVDLYHFNEMLETITHQRAGDRYPFNERTMQYRNPAFKTDLINEKNLFLFKIRNDRPMISEVRVWSYNHFHRHLAFEYIIISACLGALLVIGIYNFFLFLSTKDRVFFSYSIYIFFMFFYQFTAQGLALYFEPEGREISWLTNHGLFWSVNISCIGAIIFTRQFLNLDTFMPKLSNALSIFVIGAIFNCVGLIFMDFFLIAKLTNINASAGSVLVLICALNAAYRRYTPAYFFAVAWSLLLVSSFIISISFIGLIEYHSAYHFANLAAAVIEAVILSFALGHRINLINRKKEAEQKKKEHYFSQMEKVFHRHQLAMMQSGKPLEETMPTGKGNACVIAFDIANSSQIGHVKHHAFFESVLKKCHALMNQDYNAKTLVANAFRIKEMGDGFICSICDA